jgi:serine/threonine protein kinase
VYPRSRTERGVAQTAISAAREASCASVEITAPFDDPDESTVLDVADPDDEPTRICPSPAHGSPVRTLGRESRAKRRRLGKYELRDKLGSGAFGVVFTARDPSLDREVAIKVLRPGHLANPAIVQRFLQEARATARIAHPGIVTIHDCGQVETSIGPTAFIAMELLSGESLASRLARCGRLAPEAAIEIIRQAASALEAAHRADVLHRDLKPDNIYVVPDPAIPRGERVKVLDFGLAKLGHDGNTQLKTVFGTPRYMSPEQCRSSTQVDHRSDIYSLGCILFELVTGVAPFDGDVRQLLEHHQRTVAPRARSLAPELSSALDDLIAEMLAKHPMNRPQTMGAVQRGLQHGGDALEATTAPAPRAASSPGANMVAPGRAASSPAPRAGSSPGLPRAASSPGPADRAFLPQPAGPTGSPPASYDAASGEILVPPSGPTTRDRFSVRVVRAERGTRIENTLGGGPPSGGPGQVLTAVLPAPSATPHGRLGPMKLACLGALVVGLSVLFAWLTAG